MNIPNPILTLIAICNTNEIINPVIVIVNDGAKVLIANNIIVNIKAIIIFIRGPASATSISCFAIDLFLLKFVGFISTGFPHPKCTNISMKNPTGSICASGFKVTLPCLLGVSSPSLSAT